MFGNDESLRVHAVHNATFMIIASPVGSYYAEGINPVKIMIEDEDVRAVRGGTGYAKCGGNYAASNRAGERAEQKGYSQVLWLDGVERKYIEEVGAMNVMFKINGEVVTPKLTGSILPGITRKSCIEVLAKEGIKVSERLLSVDELEKAMEDGTLEEAWGCGTAAVVSPSASFAIRAKNAPSTAEKSDLSPSTSMTLSPVFSGAKPRTPSAGPWKSDYLLNKKEYREDTPYTFKCLSDFVLLLPKLSFHSKSDSKNAPPIIPTNHTAEIAAGFFAFSSERDRDPSFFP